MGSSGDTEKSLKERFISEGPKRILALDGGGIRGTLSLGFLEKVESTLRADLGKPEMVLSDYFDLIVGTSTGAIIAGALAIGMPVEKITEAYLELGAKVFQRSRLGQLNPVKWFKAEFDGAKLDTQLQSFFHDITLGSAELKTGLCIVTKRADTGSTWVNINHPDDRFYLQKRGILLRKLIRASTAAPTYFEPEVIDVGSGEKGSFIDGGVSTANNPSLLAFLMVTLNGFPYHWKTGADDLFILSVGTGSWRDRQHFQYGVNETHLFWARTVPGMLMTDICVQNQLLLQCISRCPNPALIDQQIGSAVGELVGSSPLLTYVRYDAKLETNSLNDLGFSNLTGKLESLRDMSAAENREILLEIGRKSAVTQVTSEHFPEAFRLPE